MCRVVGGGSPLQELPHTSFKTNTSTLFQCKIPTQISRWLGSWVDGLVGGWVERVVQFVGECFRACGRWPCCFFFSTYRRNLFFSAIPAGFGILREYR